uniref:Ribosomal protein L32 n=1 Tax=Welwitschia mirabilis TaxID=3377 RepID=B2Y204_WELMI|nr:ribosomal protein L32 [Welwitschia mirabilis]YP_001876626.1 ribosomal protein L32 [Welwitschia mirabilis]ABY26834.1 ribosomal protein L32 [Welwitschia mirabilis]ABY26839.1 ribosomal protein L32 [Welwitschia mirabilis]AMA21034.1 ribosomal protein L32 [Welwitschia mirabilis]AMA21037.1 ribosomal protein L32 [Welwitschia mirabilis]BAH11179.1 ribosomal protein L32 [Welwitschia mirabilis]
MAVPKKRKSKSQNKKKFWKKKTIKFISKILSNSSFFESFIQVGNTS